MLEDLLYIAACLGALILTFVFSGGLVLLLYIGYDVIREELFRR